VGDVLQRASGFLRLAAAGCGCVAVLTACGSGGSGNAAASASCAAPVASASTYDKAVTAAKIAAAAAQRSSDAPGTEAARGDQARLQLAWAQLIYAHRSCFSADSVAAAKEYLTGPGG
jgi:hypothetical protein